MAIKPESKSNVKKAAIQVRDMKPAKDAKGGKGGHNSAALQEKRLSHASGANDGAWRQGNKYL